jgi:expansin (peptidoglycan-binding protein)
MNRLLVLASLSAIACGGSGSGSSSDSSGSSGGSSSSSGGSGSSGAGSSSSSSSSGGVTLGQVQHGIATYYAATGAGACGFDATPNALNVAAMNIAQWQGSAVCGECVSVTGPKGKVTVRIVDQCPDCESGHLDLSKEAFSQIADVSLGRVNIDWQVVACDVSGPVAYLYKDGSSQYWTAIQVRNHKLPIASLEYEAPSGWAKVDRADYNYFVQASGMGTGSIHVRITAIDGQKLEDTLPPVKAGLLTNGAAQFQ